MLEHTNMAHIIIKLFSVLHKSGTENFLPMIKLNKVSQEKKDTNIIVLLKNGYICTLIFVSSFLNTKKGHGDDI